MSEGGADSIQLLTWIIMTHNDNWCTGMKGTPRLRIPNGLSGLKR